MHGTIRALVLSLALAGAALAADNASVSGHINGVQIGEPAAPSEQSTPPREKCVSQCGTAELKCTREVRRARQECSKQAANGGRDPFTGRSDDYSYFCSYFREAPRACGANAYSGACRARFDQRYGVCVNAMYDNIVALRYDCFRSERAAQNFCREELRDCKAACQ